MKKVFFFLLLMCFSLGGFSQLEFKLDGNIKFVDESGKEYPCVYYKYLFFPFSVKLFIVEAGGNRNYCPGEFQVDDKLRFSAIIREQCCKDNECLFLDLQSEYGFPDKWKVLNALSKFTFRIIQKNYSGTNVFIEVPTKLLVEIREKNFKRGIEIFKNSPESSVLFFRESFRDGDLDYLAKSVNFIEDNEKQSLVADVLKDVDFSSQNFSADVQYKLYMRRALAARAGDRLDESLADLAHAQKIYPNSLQPISIAYTMVRQESNSNSSNDVLKASQANPNWVKGFAEVYSNWKRLEKPEVSIGIEQINSDVLQFTSTNIAKIEKQQ